MGTVSKLRAARIISIALIGLSVSSIAAAESRSAIEPSTPGLASSAQTGRERSAHEESSAFHAGIRALSSADVAARVGPVGMAVRAGIVLHHTYEADPSGDYEISYLEGGLAVVATPATLEPQAHFEALPFPFLVLRGDLAAVRYLGVNYGLLSFDSPNADFDSAALSARRGDEQQAWGMRAGLSVTPRVKLGPVLVRSKLTFTSYHFDQPGPYVYDADLDTLLGTTDFVLTSRSDVLFELHDGPGAETLLLGPSVETRRTVDSALSRTRVGASLWYVPTERWGTCGSRASTPKPASTPPTPTAGASHSAPSASVPTSN